MRETEGMVGGGPVFVGLRPARGRTHAAWVVEAMKGRAGVGLVVPSGFEAYVRIHHRISNGGRWADTAPEYLKRGAEPADVAGSVEFIDAEGNLDADHVDALTTMLTDETSTPDDCRYALWQGWGWLHPDAGVIVAENEVQARAINDALAQEMAPVWELVATCPVEPWWGGRNMVLLDGPIDAVASIGHPWLGDDAVIRQSPQWWWPDDRAWFVGTEIDDPWTYVAGNAALIETILSSSRWEAVRVEHADAW
jgi:hypothetical protein